MMKNSSAASKMPWVTALITSGDVLYRGLSPALLPRWRSESQRQSGSPSGLTAAAAPNAAKMR